MTLPEKVFAVAGSIAAYFVCAGAMFATLERRGFEDDDCFVGSIFWPVSVCLMIGVTMARRCMTAGMRLSRRVNRDALPKAKVVER